MPGANAKGTLAKKDIIIVPADEAKIVATKTLVHDIPGFKDKIAGFTKII
jgi:hypothetical protein